MVRTNTEILPGEGLLSLLAAVVRLNLVTLLMQVGRLKESCG